MKSLRPFGVQPLDNVMCILYDLSMHINIEVHRTTEPCTEKVITIRVPLVDDIWLCVLVKAHLFILRWTQTFAVHLV